MGTARGSTRHLIGAASAMVMAFAATSVARGDDWVATFSQVGTLSTPRSNIASAATNGKVAFGGGLASSPSPAVSSNAVDIYDVASNTWTTAALSTARQDLAAAATGNKIVFAGGMDFQSHTIKNNVD